MDVGLTAAQEQLGDVARAAFAGGRPAPLVTGPLTDLVIVARELGRAAVPSRFHTDVLARLLGWDGPERVAVALHVGEGVAGFVPHATDAEILLVRTGPDSIAEIDPRALTTRPQPALGGDDRCQVVLPAQLPARPCDVDGAVARAAVVLAADAVGAAGAALDAAAAHVRERHQWGAPLASLQSVQHRCADMLVAVTTAADAVFDAAGIADRGAPEDEIRLAASYAKATAIERCRRVTADAQQLAGGQGIHADAPFHRWYRRVKAAEADLGDNRHHRELIAAALLD